ncbi:MAG TPA: isoamylase early set domain-containing protein [Candidatus Methanoperedens sp.]|nr:isoamylase early set domain-containing protein [Candidatus Methanoperedens sp.]
MAKVKKSSPAAKTTPTRSAPAEKAKAPAAAKAAGIRKKYLKARPACQVTFILPKEAAPDAESVCVLGEFNDWSQDMHPLRKLKNGDFTATVELETGHSYRFRYIIDGWKYENDWFADRYETNPYGGEDSVVDV